VRHACFARTTSATGGACPGRHRVITPSVPSHRNLPFLPPLPRSPPPPLASPASARARSSHRSRRSLVQRSQQLPQRMPPTTLASQLPPLCPPPPGIHPLPHRAERGSSANAPPRRSSNSTPKPRPRRSPARPHRLRAKPAQGGSTIVAAPDPQSTLKRQMDQSHEVPTTKGVAAGVMP